MVSGYELCQFSKIIVQDFVCHLRLMQELMCAYARVPCMHVHASMSVHM